MRPEVLAPAGSMDALRAAVQAGADAVYLGGSQFGARAYADNFTEASLIEAIEYAHIYGVKVYLTVNTLFRNEELLQLYDYLAPFYEAGLDAVIVQDFGAMKKIAEWFPKLPIHASTQMTVTTPYAYELLQRYGVTRVVPARELSTEEIAALKQGGHVPEVEVFVQGALCYCYSGQCLMSSFLGGRSGNRGRCAQPCRLPYEVSSLDGETIRTKGSYLLSPKDLCGLEAVPDLIEAGVDSFKIEGRMKKSEYVAATTRGYRKIVDACMNGTYSKKLVESVRKEMAEIFNRGGFTNGYYNKNNGEDMMSVNTPGHCGVAVGKVMDVQKSQAKISLIQSVHAGDILVIGNGDRALTLTCNKEGKQGNTIMLNVPKSKERLQGRMVMRMLHYPLMQELQRYITEERIIGIGGRMTLRAGELASLTVICEERDVMVTVEGDPVEKASAKPIAQETVKDKITQTGGTRYRFDDFVIEMEDDVFYPMKALKELRRLAIGRLEDEIQNKSRRSFERLTKEQIEMQLRMSKQRVAMSGKNNIDRKRDAQQSVTTTSSSKKILVVSSMEQLRIALQYQNAFSRIYVDMQYMSYNDILSLIEQGNSFYYMLPPVWRSRSLAEWCKLPIDRMHGIVIRNIDELAWLKSIGYTGHIVMDYSVYAMNVIAEQFLWEQFPDAILTLPVELNQKQLERLTLSNTELEVYGYQQLMVSAQCVRNTTTGCNRKNDRLYLIDRMGKHFYVASICKYCYNLIYNSVPTVLYDILSPGLQSDCNLRLHFTRETEEEMREVIERFLEGQPYSGELTRGHYKRGVE